MRKWLPLRGFFERRRAELRGFFERRRAEKRRASEQFWEMMRQDGMPEHLIQEIRSRQSRPVKRPADPNIRSNRYGGRCAECQQWVEEETGRIEKSRDGRWLR